MTLKMFLVFFSRKYLYISLCSVHWSILWPLFPGVWGHGRVWGDGGRRAPLVTHVTSSLHLTSSRHVTLWQHVTSKQLEILLHMWRHTTCYVTITHDVIPMLRQMASLFMLRHWYIWCNHHVTSSLQVKAATVLDVRFIIILAICCYAQWRSFLFNCVYIWISKRQ